VSSAFVPPKIPWQVTGNHWVSIPCVHPADGSIHALGVLHRGIRGAIEFVGGRPYLEGTAPPLLDLGIRINGEPIDWGTARMAWQRVSEWLPTFNATSGAVTIRGMLFAPVGKGNECPGAVYVLSFENSGTETAVIDLAPHGTLGARLHRVVTSRSLGDAHAAIGYNDAVILGGSTPLPGVALVISLPGATATVRPLERAPDAGAQGAQPGSSSETLVEWTLETRLSVEPGTRTETAIYLAVGPERDGAMATLDEMRVRGWRTMATDTRTALGKLEQTTGVSTADRLMNRHLMFAYFYSVARAIDDAQYYLVRTRAPWHSMGVTVRDWDALMWTIPAVQLADPDLARELILRVCEIHGYAPGRGVNYFDGAPFRSAFSIDGVAAFAIAVDRYIGQTGDDRIVDDPALADALYASYDDLTARRHTTMPLYATDVTPSGARTDLPYTLHGNAVVAEALDVLRQTLDEKTAEKIETGDSVRAAMQRHFAMERDSNRTILATATDLNGTFSLLDDPVGSAYWLPLYETLPRDDSTYRRTVKRLQRPGPPRHVAGECAQLLGPEASAALDQLRRATMDNGVAAEYLDEAGNGIGNGGDASLSGLVAYTVWYAVHALGVRL